MLASHPHGAIYIGVTSDLVQRMAQQRAGHVRGWAQEKGCRALVRFEQFADMPSAIAREKQLKNGHRGWKIGLIEQENVHWEDLAVTILDFPPLA
jgi:putative endonuclease